MEFGGTNNFGVGDNLFTFAVAAAFASVIVTAAFTLVSWFIIIVIADTKIRDQLKNFEEAGYGELPICIAKTQYSFSTDPSLKGAPTGHSLPIREIRLSSGAEFIVVVCGAIMTMPGLPRVPAADSIKLNKDGDIEGLF